MVSGRVSFEIVQKAAVAGIPIVCAVSAPSDLAIETAERLGVTWSASSAARASTSTPTTAGSTCATSAAGVDRPDWRASWWSTSTKPARGRLGRRAERRPTEDERYAPPGRAMTLCPIRRTGSTGRASRSSGRSTSTPTTTANRIRSRRHPVGFADRAPRFGRSLTNSKPKRPLMQRWPSVTVESSGEVTLRILSSWTCSSTAQPTPQYGQIVSVTRLLRRVPGAGLAHVVLGLGHQRAGRADADAVAAVDARGLGQGHGLLGRDAGVEPAPGDRDRERVLGVLAAGLDALVAEDALRVVADVEVVVDLGRLGDGRGRGVARRARGDARPRGRRARRRRRAPPAARSASGPRRSARRRPRPSRPARPDRRARCPPTSRGTRGPSCARSGPAPSRSGRPSRPRPCASTRARARASPVTSTTQTRQTLTGVRLSA